MSTIPSVPLFPTFVPSLYESGGTAATEAWVTTNFAGLPYVNTELATKFTDGGNSFGATAVLGTGDAHPLQIETDGIVAVEVDASGNVLMPGTGSFGTSGAPIETAWFGTVNATIINDITRIDSESGYVYLNANASFAASNGGPLTYDSATTLSGPIFDINTDTIKAVYQQAAAGLGPSTVLNALGTYEANHFTPGVASFATAAGTTTLTAASPQTIQFTGTDTQTCVLPDATTLIVGTIFTIQNFANSFVTVHTSGGATLNPGLIAGGATDCSQVTYTLLTNSVAAGTWGQTLAIPIGSAAMNSWGGGGLYLAGTLTATESITTTGNITGNALNPITTTTAMAGGTTTLTVLSSQVWNFTGTTANQTVVMPSALTLAVGASFTLNNLSTTSGVLTVQTNGGAALGPALPIGASVAYTVLTTATAAGTWLQSILVPQSAAGATTWGTAQIDIDSPILHTRQYVNSSTGGIIAGTTTVGGTVTIFNSNGDSAALTTTTTGALSLATAGGMVITGAGGLIVSGAGPLEVTSLAGLISLGTGGVSLGNDTSSGTYAIGSGGGYKIVIVGSATAASTTSIFGGSGGILIGTDTSTGPININTGAVARTVTVGNSTAGNTWTNNAASPSFASLLTLTTGVSLPTAGGTATALTYYERYSLTCTFTGGGTPVTGITILCSRIGNIITLTIPQITCTVSTTIASSIVNSAGALPTRFQPASSAILVVPVYTGGVVSTTVMGSIIVSGASINIFPNVVEGAWAANAGVCGTFLQTSITYAI